MKIEDLRPEYEALNSQFKLLKAYGDITDPAMWDKLVTDASEVNKSLEGTAAQEYVKALTVVTLRHIERLNMKGGEA